MEIHPITAAQTHPLRHLVLRPGQPMITCEWPGDEAPNTSHVGVFVDNDLVSIATVIRESMPNPDPMSVDSENGYRLRGMATHPDHRGQGYGTALIHLCIEHVRQAGGDTLWCNARTTAAELYRRCGFETCGSEFDLPGIGPHLRMWIDVRS